MNTARRWNVQDHIEVAMRYCKAHKAQTRQRILTSACRLFAANGYRATSIEAVMQACRLTHGGFYAHFKNKSQLYRQAMALAQAQFKAERQQGDALATLLEDYLERDARTFFATDTASDNAVIRKTYANAYWALQKRIAQQLTCDDNAALAIAALLIGTSVAIHSVDDARLQASLKLACAERIAALRANGPQSFFWEPVATRAA
jgi:TetR/AcrR family transcriptional regulator, transcriptional repressor for nem operon